MGGGSFPVLVTRGWMQVGVRAISDSQGTREGYPYHGPMNLPSGFVHGRGALHAYPGYSASRWSVLARATAWVRLSTWSLL